MSKNPSKTFFYRSPRYNIIDPFRLDGNSVLPELLKKQGQNRYYNAQADHLSYRQELISFIEEISAKLEYTEATFYLAVSMIDALLSLYSVDRGQIKMVGFMALTLSAKMLESTNKIPDQEAIVQLFEGQFDIREVANCESLLAQVLGYNLNIKTPYTFLEYFLSKGVISNTDLNCTENREIETRIAQFEKSVQFFLKLSSQYYEFYRFTSVAVATSVIACARKLLGFDYIWTSDLENLTQVSWESIEHCVDMLYQAVSYSYPDFTMESFIGSDVEEMECPALLGGFKNRGSIFTEAGESDEFLGERSTVPGFELFGDDDTETAVKFEMGCDFNC